MNRIYRRIWNATRQCWVVASELSSPRGKPAQTRLLASALLLAAAGAAWAEDEREDLAAQSFIPAEEAPAQAPVFLLSAPVMNVMGVNTSGLNIPRGMWYQTPIVMSGNYRDPEVSGQDVVALGSQSVVSGTESTVLGNYAIARGGYATAVGHDARALGGHSTALGTSAFANGKGATALGHKADAPSPNAVAIGSGAKAYSSESVAIGANSEASGTYTVSVGRSGWERRITNVKNGQSGTDAVNLDQLNAVERSTRSAASTAQTTANQASRTANDALAKANVREGLLYQSASNGVVRIGGTNSGSSLNIRNSNGYARSITGVADGAVGTSSTEAVNGSQLSRVQSSAADARTVANSAQASASNAQTTANTAKSTADSALGKANTLSGLLSHTSTTVRIGASNSGTLLDIRNSGGYARRITGVAAGSIGTSSTEAVNGAQLNSVNVTATAAKTAAGTAQTAANTAKTNAADALSQVGTLRGLLSETSTSVRVGATNSGTDLDVRNSGGAARRISGVASGVLSDTSDEAVTGAQLLATDKRARSADTLANSAVTKADSALGKVTMLEGLVREDAASGGVRLGGSNTGTVLDVRNKSDGKRRISGVADGEVSSSSSEAINGSQLFATNDRVSVAQQGASDALQGISELRAQSMFVNVGDKGPGVAAQAGPVGVALGDSAEASLLSEGGVALGSFAKARGRNSVALGRAARVDEEAEGGFALGVFSSVEETGGVALGVDSSVQKGAENAAALGAGSIATEERTVSFGNAGLKRRLTNLARGTADHNATTVGQLNDTLATLGGGAKLDAAGNVTSPTYIVQNTRQHTVGDALTILDGAVLRTTSRMDRVEGQLRSVFQDTPTARADGLNQITLAGANGMILSNVGNGLIAAGSRDAVNGGQLHSMQQQLNGRMDSLEQRIDGQPQPRTLALASNDAGTPASTPVVEEPTSPASKDDKVAANTGNAPKSSPQPKAEAPESPMPQVDTAELEKMLARANDYSDGIAREVDARLNKMDKRFNRMAAMSSAQTAMAMNTAGLATYNRLGAGVGYAEGESAMAVGYQRVLNDKGSATFSLNGAFTNSGERSMGVGVGIGW